MSIIKMFSTI